MILINNKRKYRFADSLPYVIEKYKEGGSGVTVRKKHYLYTQSLRHLPPVICRIYDVTSLLESDFHLPCLFKHLSFTFALAATVAPPDLTE